MPPVTFGRCISVGGRGESSGGPRVQRRSVCVFAAQNLQVLVSQRQPKPLAAARSGAIGRVDDLLGCQAGPKVHV